MKYKKTIYSLVLMGVSLTMPVLASANGLQYSEENRNAPSSFILKVQQRPDHLGSKGVYSIDSELFRDRGMFRESPDRSSDTDMRSYSDSLGPSFDVPNSVQGHTGGIDRPFFFGGNQLEGDPSVQSLSSPGNGGGSVPGYNGR